MSGIAGIIHFDGAPVEPGLIGKMTAAMAHRGPDGIHHWVKGSVALGQCMLRTTPESLEETQPLTNEDESLVLVMDGRVDNWEELRRELLGKNARLRDRSDAELVLRSYETWGDDCLAHIDGDFALVIWDARRRTAFCARDRMGNKPFNYHWDGKTLTLATEFHAILMMPWVPERLNEGMLAEYLAAEWHSRSETIWSGILRLESAHSLLATHLGPKLVRYWQPSVSAVTQCTSDEEFIEKYRALLDDTVRRLSRSHRTLAIQVSGGLDSTAVLSVAEHLRRNGRLAAPRLDGYTFTFAEDGAANEVAYARAAADHLGISVCETRASIPSLSGYEERAQAFRDFPGYPNGLMCAGLMSEASKQGCRAVLTGQGGDHWLHGTRAYYAEELAARRWSVLLDCLREDSIAFGPAQSLRWFLRHGAYQQVPLWIRDRVRPNSRQPRDAARSEAYWLSPSMRALLRQRREEHERPVQPTPMQPGQRRLLESLRDPLMAHVIDRFEREGARASIELRHPYWTPRFMEFALSTPERLRCRGRVSKYIHVRAMQNLMSPAVLARRDKAEFSTVFHLHLKPLRHALTETIPHRRPGWLAEDGMTRLYREYEEDPADGWRLWALWGVYASDTVLPHSPA